MSQALPPALRCRGLKHALFILAEHSSKNLMSCCEVCRLQVRCVWVICNVQRSNNCEQHVKDLRSAAV